MLDFDEEVLRPVRKYLKNHHIRVPSGEKVNWEARREGKTVVLSVELPVDALRKNFQQNLPSAPYFLFCLAYWLERATQRPTRCEISVVGNARIARNKLQLQHWRRSQFLLSEFASVLPTRFRCNPQPSWMWPPDKPILNYPLKTRESKESGAKTSEHDIEVRIAGSQSLLDGFRRIEPGFDRFRRQFPLGLFNGRVSRDTAWTPGGSSQVDLWGTSSAGRVLHLFELKKKNNTPLGIIPEAFYYSRMLNYVRCPLPDGRRIDGREEGYKCASRATRIVMWLIAPSFHPLILSQDDSPLRWLNNALAGESTEFRVLAFNLNKEGELTWGHRGL